MTELHWKGHQITLDSRLVAKYLWSTTETVILVDGVEIARGGGFRLTEKIVGGITENNLSHELSLVIKVDLLTFTTVPYQLFIDNNLIAKGRLEISNSILSIVPGVLLPLSACILTMLILTFIS